jgi:hypothetical protein
MKPRLLTPEPTDGEIRHEAFLLWERRGRPVGCDLDIWLEAKERLKHLAPRKDRDRLRPKDTAHRPRDAQDELGADE